MHLHVEPLAKGRVPLLECLNIIYGSKISYPGLKLFIANCLDVFEGFCEGLRQFHALNEVVYHFGDFDFD